MRRRILVAIVAATAVAVILFAVPLGFALSSLYREEEVVRLERTAAESAEHIPEAFPHSGDPVELPRRDDGRSIALYDRDGALITGLGPATPDAIVRRALRGDVRDAEVGDRLVLAAPVTRGERVVGALRVTIPLSVVTDRVLEAILIMAGIGLVAVGVSTVIAVWQSRRLARPVLRLAHDAALLGDGDFTVRSEPSGVNEVDTVSRSLDATAARLDAMLTREQSFSADASHQLLTPLTSLRVTLEAASLDPASDQRIAVAAALEDVDRLERTVEDLLALAREAPVDRTPCDIAALLASLEDAWHGRLAAAGRPLRIAIDPHLPRVAVSARALRQILDVLVDNASRHGTGAVTVRARSAPPGVVVEVSDEGEGVIGKPERIFERRAPESRGHGIGLALARSLAEAEGARLVLEDPGPGPVFAVFLPAAR